MKRIFECSAKGSPRTKGRPGENPKALEGFVNSGWQASTDADAAAKGKTQGAAYSGAVAVAPGVWVYQITKEGLALQLTLQGTKYYKDDDLNKN